jgi:hypothetical protein
MAEFTTVPVAHEPTATHVSAAEHEIPVRVRFPELDAVGVGA